MPNSVTLTTKSIPVSSGGGNSTQDQTQIPDSYASLTIDWDDGPLEYKIGPGMGDEAATLERGGDSGSVKIGKWRYAFPSEAVITVDGASESGRPTESYVVKYNSAEISWIPESRQVRIVDQEIDNYGRLGGGVIKETITLL
jgi:hypothetical protein